MLLYVCISATTPLLLLFIFLILKKILINALKFILSFGAGALIVWYLVSGYTPADIEKIKKSLSEANYTWVIISMAAGILAHISRAVRWKMLLAPLGIVPRLSNTFYAVMIGYFGNLLFPRAGEVLRCGIMKGYEKIPLTQSIGTVITERIIDTSLLLLIFIFSVWREYERLQSYIAENITGPLKTKLHSVFENKLTLLLLAGTFIFLLALFFIYRKRIFQNPVIQKIRGVLLSFVDGMRSVRKVKSPLSFIFHSIFIWTMYLMSVYLCVYSFEETKTLSIIDCIVLMAFGSLGVIAVQGGIGAYQWIVLQIMLIWGYSETIGFAFGLVVWAAQTIVVLIGGPVCFGLIAIANRKK